MRSNSRKLTSSMKLELTLPWQAQSRELQPQRTSQSAASPPPIRPSWARSSPDDSAASTLLTSLSDTTDCLDSDMRYLRGRQLDITTEQLRLETLVRAREGLREV